MKILILLTLLLTSCGYSVYKDHSGLFVCDYTAFMHNETYKYEVLKNATEKCEDLKKEHNYKKRR